MFIRVFNHIALHFHVLHDEIGTVKIVGHNASDECSCKHYCIWLFFIEKLSDGQLISQIQFLVTPSDEVRIAALL